jgi:uncharacterized DUF497 family protein
MFEWDIAKSAKNLRERGFDFVYAAKVFERPTLEADDKRAGYGERRVRAIGEVDGEVLFVVYTWRGEVRRIISARLANRKERNAYRAIYG